MGVFGIDIRGAKDAQHRLLIGGIGLENLIEIKPTTKQIGLN